MDFLNRFFGPDQQEEDEESHEQIPSRPEAGSISSKPEFPLGKNVIADVDIKTFEDLSHYYPLPAGFIYHQRDDGAPEIIQTEDGKAFSFLIEADLLTFDAPATRLQGKPGYETIDVLKRTVR